MESIVGIFNSLADAKRAAARPVVAFGLIGAAILGFGGAVAGAAAGDVLDKAFTDGLPHDELYVYEDALRRGRTVVIAFADDGLIAENARTALGQAGAESVDAAREESWIGLRSAEQEHYTGQGETLGWTRQNIASDLKPLCIPITEAKGGRTWRRA